MLLEDKATPAADKLRDVDRDAKFGILFWKFHRVPALYDHNCLDRYPFASPPLVTHARRYSTAPAALPLAAVRHMPPLMTLT